MKVASVLVVAALTLLKSVQAVDIDKGFAQDGTTTYCMGVSAANGSVGTLSFESLEASNVGRCPVGVALTLTSTSFHVNDPITIKWAAKMIPGLPNAIFPNAIDPATKLPGAVTMSSLFACTSGTNCATNVGGTPTGADGTSTGPFSPDGTKALETNTFTLKAAGDFIIVGLISLPGDSTLNLSAEEYIVFKKISVVSADSSTATSGPPAPSSDSKKTQEKSSAASPEDNSDKPAEQNSKAKSTTSEDVMSDHSPSVTTASNEKDVDYPGVVKSASTSNGNRNFLKDNGMVIIAVVVGCCVVGFVAFAFVMCRRKDQRMKGNKDSLSSDMDDHGGKIDLTYVANATARNNNNGTETMMDEDSVVMMPSAERGSELNSSNGSSALSLPMSSLEKDEYSDTASYAAAGLGNKAQMDAYRVSNISSIAGQSEASMSNFGDSIVSARQKQYLQPSDWNEPVPPNRCSYPNSTGQSVKGKGSFEEHSTVSRYSEDEASRVTGTSNQDSARTLGFSVSSHPTDSCLTEDYRVTEELHGIKDSRTADFSEAMGDSYGFRTSRSSVDSYSSGVSSYSREGSHISRFSGASSLDRLSDISKY